MAEKIWTKFERNVKKQVNNVDSSVLQKLKTNFMDTPINYLKSNECEVIMKDTVEKISYDKLKIYIHLLDLQKYLKSATKLKRKHPAESNVIKKRKIEEEHDTVVVAVKDEEEDFLDYYNGCPTKTISADTIEAQPVDEHQLKIDRYITKLENVLDATKIQIERLEEDELTLDDLDQENNSFTMLDKLKAHCVKVWRKICKLKKTNSRLHRKILKTFIFKGTIYTDLNEIIENFVKMKKFPDYHDIKILVSTFVKDKAMKMSGQKVSQLAVDIFTQIGNQLKKKRIGDYVSYFGNHLTDLVKPNENPILTDDNLKRVLINNYSVGQLKMDEILDKYSRLEQLNGAKDEDNASDISTEHSVLSENEDIDENLEDINLETLRQQTNDNDEIDHEDVAGDSVEVHVTEDFKGSPVVVNNADYLVMPVPTQPTEPSGQLIERCAGKDRGPAVVDMVEPNVSPAKDPQIDITEIQAHTFKFNLDQIQQGEGSTVYPSTIVINSSDESDSNSSDESLDACDYNFAYSSKLDDFCVVNRKKMQPIDTGIFINIEDSDDADS